MDIRGAAINTESSFFDLGGHSISAAHLISRINEVFGVGVPLSRLFQDPRIRPLADFIDSKLKAKANRQKATATKTLQQQASNQCSAANVGNEDSDEVEQHDSAMGGTIPSIDATALDGETEDSDAGLNENGDESDACGLNLDDEVILDNSIRPSRQQMDAF